MKQMLIVGFVALGAAPLMSQGTSVAAQLSGRAPDAVIQAAQALADSATVAGVPVSPLVQKALEGAAKNIPADRVIAALGTLFRREVAARGALRDGGLNRPDDAAVDGATFAMGAGLSTDDVASIARAGGDAYAAGTTMRVAGTLTALGVPASGTVQLLSVALASGVAPADLVSFPGSLESSMAHGMSAAQAAEGLARAAQARHHGALPGHGRPGGKPPKP